jgi:hypothetical protein
MRAVDASLLPLGAFDRSHSNRGGAERVVQR